MASKTLVQLTLLVAMLSSCGEDSAEPTGDPWAFNANGDGVTNGMTTPNNAPTPRLRTVKLKAGYEHTCLLRLDGAVSCWGGDGPAVGRPESDELSPAANVIDGLQDVVDIALGVGISCGLSSDGTSSCWGAVGPDFADINVRHIPQRVPGIEDASDIEVLGAWLTSCHLVRDTVQCALSNGASVPELRPVTAISSGNWYVCGLHDDGTATCWGGDGELLPIHDDLDDAVALYPGYPACVLHADETVTCVDGHIDTGYVRKAVPGLRNPHWIESGWGVTCAITAERDLVCWGGREPVDELAPIEPVQVRGLSNLHDVAVGGEHICTVDDDGAVACWGEDEALQLGEFAIEHLFP